MANLPTDRNAHAIQALRPAVSGGAHSITTSGTTDTNGDAFADDTKIIGVVATEDAFIRLGTSTVEATTSDHFLPAGVYFYFNIDGNVTHLAAIQSTSAGVVYISEME